MQHSVAAVFAVAMLNLDVLLSYDVEENASCDGVMRFLHILVRVGRVEAWMHRAGWYVSADAWGGVLF